MKLTLRTLLSWKDGMLPAAAEREIAAKVAESPVARQLAARIEAVVADPALPAPGAGGSAVDANATAAYLDNVLEGPALEEFERACIAASDVLAEAAACHEMLAELARQSATEATLDADGREMLLVAVRARAAIRGIALPPGAAKSTTAAGDLRAEPEWPVASDPDAAPAAGVTAAAPVVVVAPPAGAPARGRDRVPTSAWLFAIAAVALLAALVGVLGWSLSRGAGRRAREVAEREPAAPAAAPVPDDRIPPQAAAAAPADELAPPDEPAVAPPDDPPAAPPPAAATPPPASDVIAPHDAAAPAPAPPAPVAPPVAEPAAAAPADVSVPQGDALAIAAPAPVDAPVDMPAGARDGATPAAAPPPNAATGVVVAGNTAVLWRPHDDPAAAWAAAAPAADIGLPVDLLAPPFCRPVVVVGGVRIELEPSARAVIARDSDGGPRLTLVGGAAAATAERGDTPLGITAEGLVGTATLPPGAACGVEVERLRPPGGDALETRARVVAPRGGGLAWHQTEADGSPRGVLLRGVAAQAPLDGLDVLEWRAAVPESATIVPTSAAPRWLAARGDAVDRAAAGALTAAFAANADPRPALEPLVADRRVEHRMAAAATLAQLGDVGPLADLLCSDDPRRMLSEGQWTRLLAAGVAPLGGAEADALVRALADRGPAGAGDTLARMAAGFSAADLEAGADAELVAALESPHLVVRRYAIATISEIARPTAVERLEYRADRPAEMLREGAAWWRGRQEEGRIRRVAAPPPPAG